VRGQLGIAGAQDAVLAATLVATAFADVAARALLSRASAPLVVDIPAPRATVD
jgi:hypothetical protein